MPVLPNARHERFAQNLAAGMTGDAAYEAAGFAPNRHNASRLKTTETVRNRVAELTQCGANAVADLLSAKQRFIQAAYERLAKEVPTIELKGAADLKAIADAALALDKDERVVEGGVSDRQSNSPSVTVNVVAAEVDEIFARKKPVQIEAKPIEAIDGEHQENRIIPGEE
jgi:hypothetical protein